MRQYEEMMDAVESRSRRGEDLKGGCLKGVAFSEGLLREDVLGGMQKILNTLGDIGLSFIERSDEWLGD